MRTILKVMLIGVFMPMLTYAQDGAVINGNLETNFNIFLRDSNIGAVQQPQYQHQFYGGETWLNLNYNYAGFSAGIRYDIYQNSILRDPNGSYTDQGLGRWFVKKSFDKFDFQIGNIYEQIGSGIIFRSYEQRPLFIDNALIGGSVKYHFTDNITAKGIVGRQKNAFDLWGGNLRGMSVDGFWSIGEEKPVTIAPGIGFMNKTISEEGIEKVVGTLSSYQEVDRFTPQYNNYAFSLSNTLTYSNFSWYFEGAYKTKDIFDDPEAIRTTSTGTAFGKLVNRPGSVIYNSVSFAKGKVGITLESKRTENFVFRIDPSARLLRGLISYIPPMTRVNTYRLTARYNPATQEISEIAFQGDIRVKINKKISTLINGSFINRLDNTPLYREIFTEVLYKPTRDLQITTGVQHQVYNQTLYEGKAAVPMVKTFTPYLDVLYKFSRTKSLRVEAQSMTTAQDFGSWLFGLAEFSIAPHWIFELSSMYNVKPKGETSLGIAREKIIYPTFGAVYIAGSNRFQLRYVKQVEGIVCSGGICRLEPAFSGVRFSMTSNF